MNLLLQKILGRFTGANRVTPAEADNAAPKETEAEVDNSPAKGKDRSIWSDSEYSSEDASFRSSYAGELSSPRESSPPNGGSRSSRQRATPNPLLLAFPVRSDEQTSGPAKDNQQSSDSAINGANVKDAPARSKKGI